MTTDHPLPCGCGGGVEDDLCAPAELPENPFVALRVAAGMLLGESDFRVMLGNPRGKLMLHNAWLHGAGVVWGLPVRYDPDLDELHVGAGLAVDGRGRELRLEGSWCVNVLDWAQEWVRTHPARPGTAEEGTDSPEVKSTRPKGDDGGRSLSLWVVLEPCPCLDRKVPALADPCDVTRRHDDYSRVVEQARVRIVDTDPTPQLPYPRVRALLGLVDPAGGGPPVQEALQEAAAVVARPQHERARALLAAMRRMAAKDVTELGPPTPAGTPRGEELYPVTEDCSAVVLARLGVDLTEDGDCLRVREVYVDPAVRRAVLPTTTIQELTCGLAPGVLGGEQSTDAGGPRLRKIRWSSRRTQVRLHLTAPAAPGSEESAVAVSSLSDEGRGWAHDGVRHIRLEDDGRCVVVDLDRAPAYETVRIIVRGTGEAPLFGAEPRVPFAGPADGPPAGAHDGHDAVVTTRFDGAPAEDASDQAEPTHDDLEEWT
ncbi:hypothetical protein PU560_10590 [Georgenia sp. 10Sc9-8]|uniref:LigA protein n=1 Tax=Georgenia halotolerans TaxID=3028317 RepID=A0ABT5TXW9_9MICO|nr:hypothetical protein [Georgenia halotolerans]